VRPQADAAGRLWNPLALVAFPGEFHYTSLFLLAMVATWQAWDAGRPYGAALATGAASLLALRWVSVPLALFVLVRGPQRLRRRLLMLSALVLPLLITLPLVCGLESCVPIPFQSRFVQTGRSTELIPALVGLMLPFTRQANWPCGLPALCLSFWCLCAVAGASRGSPKRTWHPYLLLSPIMHAWYATWLMPVSVATRQLESRLLSLSVFN